MRLLTLAAMLCALSMGGAALSQVPAQVAAQPAPPPQDPAMLAAAIAAFAPGAGKDQAVAACAACHPATMITAKRFDEDKWAEVVQQMIDKGAKVRDDDFEVIVSYLARSYGADKPL